MSTLNEDLNSRFWSKVRKTKTCWIWTAGKFTRGYGVFRMNTKSQYAHRVAWFLTYGTWPINNMCHICDNVACVRPSHMFDGTQGENLMDTQIKGKFKNVGRKHKLDHSSVMEIKDKYASGLYSSRRLARHYGVCSRTILNLVHKNIDKDPLLYHK